LIDFRADLLPRFLNIAVWGFVLNLVTGIALFVSRGQDYITSLIFLLKIMLVAVGALILFWLRSRFSRMTLTSDVLAVDVVARSLSLVCAATWVGAVVSGRLIAYLSDLY
jgi:predicted membrane-bound mannosyltransferase